jgi:hypothetical protein
VVWSKGIGPTDLATALPFPKDQGSRLLADRYSLVKGASNVYAIGNCATIEGMNLPATSQVAQQQGRYLARHLRRLVQHQTARPFRYRHFGMLAYVGSNKALANLATIKLVQNVCVRAGYQPFLRRDGKAPSLCAGQAMLTFGEKDGIIVRRTAFEPCNVLVVDGTVISKNFLWRPFYDNQRKDAW